MRPIAIIISLLLIGQLVYAGPVEKATAIKAGSHYLQMRGLMKADDSLTLHTVFNYDNAGEQTTCFYVFNLANRGFVLVSADDRSTPILSYSMNGCFDRNSLPESVEAWLNGYAEEIGTGIAANAPVNKEILKQWNELVNATLTTTPGPKSDSYLLTSTWEQGYGYNNYCPKMNGNPVVVGCVATAMAQIIRYYQYPTRGFGSKSYRHETYGILAVDFDTTDYDYSLMPDRVRHSSSAQQKDMVSRLCYHCGIVVEMRYQNPNHMSGSGSFTHLVPEALKHFGYTDADYYKRANVNDDNKWKALIRNEIDNSRPIEYAGTSSSQGGHAFVLDGYNNNDKFHFNWGWGGSYDGFYTLSTMVGFSSDHEMVINIKPSGWDGHLTHFLVSPNGTGDGTTWNKTNSNLAAAVKLNKLVARDIWMKEGIYYGDTTDEYAFRLINQANVLGGFAGDETTSSERDAKLHPTILDGGNRRKVLYGFCNYNSSKMLTLNGLIIQNGYSENGSCVELLNNVKAMNFEIRQCHSDSGEVVSLSDCLMNYSVIHSNNAPVSVAVRSGALRQSIVSNNVGNATSLHGSGRVINCDIVCNQGAAVVMNGQRNVIANNIIWNNDSSVSIRSELSDTSIRYNAIVSDTAFADSTLIQLSETNDDEQGPRFIQPCNVRGPEGYTGNEDWSLQRGSICIDAGEKIQESVREGDMNHSVRCRNGAVDLGCYESNYPVSIPSVSDAGISLYPNPAVSTIVINNTNGRDIKLYDVSGRLILHQKGNQQQTHVDINHLSDGVYMLHVGDRVAKIIKKQ